MDLASLAQPQPAPQAPQGMAGLVQQPPQARPVPNHAQTIAGLHRMHEIEKASERLLKDPDVGHKNIRPKVLEMGADLIGAKVMTLPELMSGIKDFPGSEDILGQKKWLQRLRDSQIQGQMVLLQDHANSPPEAADAEPWSPESHDQHMSAVKSMYQAK
jgi:hypothetical protein